MKTALLATILVVIGIGTASADTTGQPNDDLVCQNDPIKLSSDRYLRAASLDLRGILPSDSELEALDEMPSDAPLPADLLDGWLGEDAFVDQVVRHHRKFFWNNLSQVDLIDNLTSLSTSNQIFWVRDRSRNYRTGTRDRVTCWNEPAAFNADGSFVTREDDDGFQREGWVEVTPYWAPETTVRVCGLDAQANRFASDGTDCALPAGRSRTDCGCGPNLRWCAPNMVERQILTSMASSLDALIRDALINGDNYLELFESRHMFVDGPMVHFFNHLAPVADINFTPSPVEVNRLPDIPYTEDVWHNIPLNAAHAGVLTHPSFLLRFQTNRARASRFYEAFLCAPFVPPDGGLPPATEEEARDPDLQRRAGCKYCHASLEPAAAHWGRWTETGAGFLDPDAFPALDENCLRCARGQGGCTQACRRNYLTRSLSEKDEPYLGMLNAYVYRQNRHMHYVEQGPKLLTRATVADNRFPTCVAQKTAEWLMGRTLTPKDAQWLDRLAIEFVQSGFQYRDLVKTIIQSPQYRRVQ